jgi:hypothetical protein
MLAPDMFGDSRSLGNGSFGSHCLLPLCSPSTKSTCYVRGWCLGCMQPRMCYIFAFLCPFSKVPSALRFHLSSHFCLGNSQCRNCLGRLLSC